MVGKFVWDDYLHETNCIAAPHEIFKEVSKKRCFSFFFNFHFQYLPEVVSLENLHFRV